MLPDSQTSNKQSVLKVALKKVKGHYILQPSFSDLFHSKNKGFQLCQFYKNLYKWNDILKCEHLKEHLL